MGNWVFSRLQTVLRTVLIKTNYTGGSLSGYYSVGFDGEKFQLPVNATAAECEVRSMQLLISIISTYSHLKNYAPPKYAFCRRAGSPCPILTTFRALWNFKETMALYTPSSSTHFRPFLIRTTFSTTLAILGWVLFRATSVKSVCHTFDFISLAYCWITRYSLLCRSKRVKCRVVSL